MKNPSIRIIALVLLHLCSLYAFAQDLYHCDHEVMADGHVRIKKVYNNDKEHFIDVYIDSKECGRVKPNESVPINKICMKNVKVAIQGAYSKEIFNVNRVLSQKNEPQNVNSSAPTEQGATKENISEQKNGVPQENVSTEIHTKTSMYSIESSEVTDAFKIHIDTVAYFSDSYYNNLRSDVNSFVDAMKHMDQDNKKSYIREQRLNGYLTDAKNNLKEYQDGIDGFIEDFIKKNYSGIVINDKQRCLDEMQTMILSKLKEREDAIAVLEEAISGGSVAAMFDDIVGGESTFMNICIAILLFVALLIIVLKFRHKKSAKTPTAFPIDTDLQNAQANIVVRRKTTSILKKQSLEDVHNNSEYLKIDCADFCEDSAVRRIYFKNTCIKDIYNMYAEDLRNPENPNEDGCMVLGRWVHDTEADEYYVSLEEIVKPGDDAVFKEYELNFGGKIKLKVSEKLRKLRRETNLQYDMTCWVHSHPGLGVFFSNADSGVQMQLKHPTHPKFLTAIVIDILTPDQELGIFTFKHDMSINSKPELKKMYSLEEMYKWAVSSDRNSFKAEDYYNLMLASKERIDSCYGVQLSNGAIIDMCQMEAEQQSGLVGWVQGYNCKKGSRNEFVAKSVSKEEAIPDNDVLGCFMIGSHRSLPTIRKAITNSDKIQFVLFYSTSDKMLTAIPVVDGQLSVEDKYYGEEKLEELKIWTRRKR